MTTIKKRVEKLFGNSRKYTAASASKVLNIKYETGRKYVRELLYEAKLGRIKEVDPRTGRKMFRYFSK